MQPGLRIAAAIATLLGAAFLWSYWPMFVGLETVWSREPDYSHGYLIAPIAAYIIWSRRAGLAALELTPSLWGFLPLLASFGLRYVGAFYYIDPIEHASALLWLFGACWLAGGFRLVVWSLPVLAFLTFLFPMPFRIESWFSGPLQRGATLASCWLLQAAGQPSFADGNVIHMGQFKLEVVHACSGLRMLTGFLALCTAYAILTQRTIYEKGLIFLSAMPIALLCNVLRIAITGILYQYVSASAAQKFTHDLAGWAMMPMALFFLATILWYLDRLFVDSEVTESTIIWRRQEPRISL